MVLCCRFFHRHMAMKTMRMRTMTPSTQPTIRYSMSLLRAGLVAGPARPPLPEALGGVLKSLTGYSEAPGTRFTCGNKKENMMRDWIWNLNSLLSKEGWQEIRASLFTLVTELIRSLVSHIKGPQAEKSDVFAHE